VNRFGLFGGTFDPIHEGHLDVARAARRALRLNHVILLPSNIPPHREAPHASASQRFAMAAMAVAGEDGLVVSDVETRSPGPSYTATTLDRLEARGLTVRDLFYIAGADAFADIASWRNYPHLLDRCHFIVVSRPERPAPALRQALPALADRMIDAALNGTCEVPAGPSIFLVDAPTSPVSSTEIRRLASGALDLTGLVPDLVAAHIRTHELYEDVVGPKNDGSHLGDFLR
jgi:nicotinate-nucleotide adenylyltransferase